VVKLQQSAPAGPAFLHETLIRPAIAAASTDARIGMHCAARLGSLQARHPNRRSFDVALAGSQGLKMRTGIS